MQSNDKTITLSALYDQIYKTEMNLVGELWNFWQLIKIDPVKWNIEESGYDGREFWVVAICGTTVVWYDDIEFSFNLSKYRLLGQIANYRSYDLELNSAIEYLFSYVKFGGEIPFEK